MSAMWRINDSRRRDLNPRPADYESAAIPLSHEDSILLVKSQSPTV